MIRMDKQYTTLLRPKENVYEPPGLEETVLKLATKFIKTKKLTLKELSLHKIIVYLMQAKKMDFNLLPLPKLLNDQINSAFADLLLKDLLDLATPINYT